MTERTPGQFRRVVDTLLGLWGLGELVDDARLVATELLTNVHRHTDGRCEVVLLASPSGVHIQVRDYSLDMPQARFATPDQERGRGVVAVNQFATWHVRRLADGKIVSAFLAPPGTRGGRSAAC
ncbi:ATP-binding protein [Streptomyces sp. RTd22]|uniref:ATP-binding protein n=1 Tax=Streptomyces sp. RTd22 TaxID=1841249 RepID=UPI00131D860F|nr:ATP-binding protein [Streptomyces sp. RTd22]